ncbi:hypothetical protein [Nostoc sp. FACHB-145]|uniref:hypothetical protein n=1 Tax=Nostoc sp. FACHB-145 TaxID=2692836 RepID=UPI001688FB10|nr:hypothetical protein [Nostoc sp. FACHB-145]MBD2471710.1 hypothetical protein [Nostoc sp. FACHB-145]
MNTPPRKRNKTTSTVSSNPELPKSDITPSQDPGNATIPVMSLSESNNRSEILNH